MIGGGSNKDLGRLGEKLASEFLVKNGCQIIDQNFNTRYGEIDLIAKQADLPAQAGEILFCEVKTRSSLLCGYPENAVNDKKLDHLLRAARIYLRTKSINGFWRVDVISVEADLKKRTAKIYWFKNVAVDR